MKTVVITGSTRGIGLGLAQEFLKRSCSVVVSGRSQQSVAGAVAGLSRQFDEDHVCGFPCDVSDIAQVEALRQFAVERLGRIDIWINNAGVNHSVAPMWELSPGMVKGVVETNVLGVIYGSQVALRGMLQQGSGQLFNMEGFGSDGRMMAGMSVYGGSKYTVRYLTQTLAKETAGTSVLVGALSPGMVVTDMLTAGANDGSQKWAQSKRIFNILGDRVETVTPWLVEKVLQNNKTGVRFAWLTPVKIMRRFALARFQKRELFDG